MEQQTMQKKDEIPVLTDDCPHRLECALKRIGELDEKAQKWDLLRVTAHRFGVGITEIVMFIDEKVRHRNE